MASELRVNQITSQTGLGTVTFDAAGGVTFAANPTFTGSSTFNNINTTSINTGSISGTRNRVVNGSMRIDQRNDGAPMNPVTTGVYTIDRWVMAFAGTFSVRVQGNLGSVTPPVGFTSYFGVQNNTATTPTGTDNLHVQHRIEGHNISDFSWGTQNAKTVTLSFWVRSSLVGLYGGSIRNNANDRSYVYEYRIDNANTWEYKTVTIPGDTTGTWLDRNNTGLRLIFGLGAGSGSQGPPNQWSGANYTNSTNGTVWTATANATWYLTGVQLELGTRATEFERINYQQELALCQRYYEKSANWAFMSGITGIANRVILPSHSVTMRSDPTYSISNPSTKAANSTYEHSSATARLVSSISDLDLVGEGKIQSTAYAQLSSTPTYSVYGIVEWDAEL